MILLSRFGIDGPWPVDERPDVSLDIWRELHSSHQRVMDDMSSVMARIKY
jgi:hypothetical protein